MDALKDYIEENSGLFTEQSMPEGDTGRFLAKLEKSGIKYSTPGKRTFSWYRAFALPAAAMVILLLGVGIFAKVTSEENQLTRIYVEYCGEVASLSTEIQMMTEGEDLKAAQRTVDNITFEAIPFEQQLPPELPKRERLRIMKEYYTQKLDGVRRLKNLISDSYTEE